MASSSSDSRPAATLAPTTLYVLIPPSPLFAAHWSLFIPDAGSSDTSRQRHNESRQGRRIHVSGDRLNGFALEIIRGYDSSKHCRVGSRRFPIGTLHLHSISTDHMRQQNLLEKDEDDGGGVVDNRATDNLERVCLDVEAPGPSLNRVAGAGDAKGKRTKTEVRDCQWWVRRVVETLENEGMLTPLSVTYAEESKQPHVIVASLPVH